MTLAEQIAAAQSGSGATPSDSPIKKASGESLQTKSKSGN